LQDIVRDAEPTETVTLDDQQEHVSLVVSKVADVLPGVFVTVVAELDDGAVGFFGSSSSPPQPTAQPSMHITLTNK
jgi:hypothetical protein